MPPMSSALFTEAVAAAPRQRAGRVLLFLGVLEIVIFGLTTFAVLRAAPMSVAELQNLTGANLSLDQLRAVQPHLRSFALFLALSGLLPGVIILLCAIAVGRGRNVPAFVALLLIATQLFALGGILIRQMLAAFAQGDPPAMTLNVLAFGTPMAFLIFVIRCLFQLRPRGEEQAAIDADASHRLS